MCRWSILVVPKILLEFVEVFFRPLQFYRSAQFCTVLTWKYLSAHYVCWLVTVMINCGSIGDDCGGWLKLFTPNFTPALGWPGTKHIFQQSPASAHHPRTGRKIYQAPFLIFPHTISTTMAGWHFGFTPLFSHTNKSSTKRANDMKWWSVYLVYVWIKNVLMYYSDSLVLKVLYY